MEIFAINIENDAQYEDYVNTVDTRELFDSFEKAENRRVELQKEEEAKAKEDLENGFHYRLNWTFSVVTLTVK